MSKARKRLLDALEAGALQKSQIDKKSKVASKNVGATTTSIQQNSSSTATRMGKLMQKTTSKPSAKGSKGNSTKSIPEYQNPC